MAMGKLLLCVFAVVVAMSLMQASEAQAACTLNDLAPCLNAVSQPNQGPTGPCCATVAAVDVPCFCNLVQSASYPKAYVDRAVLIPKLCGGDAYKHFQGKNCGGHVIG